MKKNPKDEFLLKRLIIIKEPLKTNPNYVYYTAYLGVPIESLIVAEMEYSISSKKVNDSWVKEEYRRKGVASFIYDYIEKDQNIELTEGATTTKGHAFWMNRCQRKNPRDEKLLKEIYIKTEPYIEDGYIRYKVIYNNKIIGFADFNIYFKWVDLVSVNEPFKRKGIATYLYDYIEKVQKVKLKPSYDILPEGKKFWKKRLQNEKTKKKKS